MNIRGLEICVLHAAIKDPVGAVSFVMIVSPTTNLLIGSSSYFYISGLLLHTYPSVFSNFSSW